jgi:hypothetical protein
MSINDTQDEEIELITTLNVSIERKYVAFLILMISVAILSVVMLNVNFRGVQLLNFFMLSVIMRASLDWVPLCWVSLCWVLLCWVSLWWVSLYLVIAYAECHGNILALRWRVVFVIFLCLSSILNFLHIISIFIRSFLIKDVPYWNRCLNTQR